MLYKQRPTHTHATEADHTGLVIKPEKLQNLETIRNDHAKSGRNASHV